MENPKSLVYSNYVCLLSFNVLICNEILTSKFIHRQGRLLHRARASCCYWRNQAAVKVFCSHRKTFSGNPSTPW
jgi:hypothetical protein